MQPLSRVAQRVPASYQKRRAWSRSSAGTRSGAGSTPGSCRVGESAFEADEAGRRSILADAHRYAAGRTDRRPVIVLAWSFFTALDGVAVEISCTAIMFGKCYNGGLMPMLHGCAYEGCETFTLSTYCFEHELVIRAEIEAGRVHVVARDEPTTRESTDAAQRA
jgi:hypothetical protein